MLDLLLIGDEMHNAETNKFNQHLLHSFRGVFRELHFTAADAAAVGERFGVESYLVDVKGGTLFGERVTASEYVAVMPHRPSLGLCDLATVARDAGYEVAVVDNVLRYAFRRRQMLDLLETQRPRLVGISATHLHADALRRLAALVREAAPQAKLVIGGPTLRRAQDLHRLADFVVFGAGEDALVAILRAMDGEGPLDAIPLIAYRDASGELRYSAAAQQVVLHGNKPYSVRAGERIPVPDWSLYPRSADNVYPIEFSRGCKYNCAYCSYDRGKNVRPLAEIREELLRNAALGITKYRVGDSNFTDGPPRMPDFPHQVCRLMKQLDLGLQWSCFSRADDFTPELAALMREAGCFAVFFGIETGDDELMKLMQKGHTVAHAYRAIEIAQRAGIHAHANFIIGYPGETAASARRTVDFILASRPDTVTLGQFFLEEYAPIQGPRKAAVGLEGRGNRWRHSTMDADAANRLIAEAAGELARERISLGSEYALVERMSFGLSFEQCKRQYQQTKALLAPSAAPAERDAARAELRKLYLETIPAAVAREQRVLAGAVRERMKDAA